MISVNNKNRQNRKGRIGRRLLAVLICLLTIMPMVSSALPEFTDMVGGVVGGISDALGSGKRPDADSYSEGAKYLDDFLKEHPDATVFGRGDDICGQDRPRPTSVGTPGDRIDPDWFLAVVNVMGILKAQGEFTLRPTNRKNDGLKTLWDAEMPGLYINYPEEKQADDSIGRYTTEKSWPISGYMNWVAYGEYKYVDGGNYPELSTIYGASDINYGITGAYLGYSRVYNVGVIAVNEEVEKEVDGELTTVTETVKYLWVSIDEEGDDDGVIVLPDKSPNHNVVLHFGPREYPVDYDIVVNDLYLGKKENGAEGTVNKNLSEMTVDEMRMVWGEDVIPKTVTDVTEARGLVMKKVFGTFGEDSDTVTKNQTAQFDVTIPYGTYGDVTYVTTVNKTATTLYPSESGYGKNRLGTEPNYVFDVETSENPDDYWAEINTDDGGPDRFSVSEKYTLGTTGVANGAVTVTVTITRRHSAYSYTTDTDDEGEEYINWENNGYKTNFEPLGTYHFNFISTGNNFIYKKWLNAGYAAAKPNDDGTFDAKIMFSRDFVNASNAVSQRLVTLEINEQEVNLPYGGTTDAYDESIDGVPAITKLDDGSTVKVWYVYLATDSERTEFRNWCNTGAGHTKYPKLSGVNDDRYHGVYIVEITGAKRNVTITNLEKDDDSSSVGKIIVDKATGVNVQLWYYKQYSARGNSQDQRWWESKGVDGWSRIRYHRSIDQHGKFRFFDSASRGVPGGNSSTESNIYQEYNVRVSLKNGFYWPGTDRYGVLRDTDGNEVTTITDTERASYEYNSNATTRVTDPVTLVKYPSTLAANSSNRYSSLRPTNITFSSSREGDTRSSLTLKPDGTYTAYLKRTTNNTRRSESGTWSYDRETKTLTLTYNRDYPSGVTVTATGDPLVFTLSRNTSSNLRGNQYESDFKISVSELPLEEYYPNWYYASLNKLPYLKSAAAKNTYLRFEAVPRTYELRYLSGAATEDGKTVGIGPNSQYDQYGFNNVFNLKENTMPYYDNDANVAPYYIDSTLYSKADAKGLEPSFHIYKGEPEDNGNIVANDKVYYTFQYWVLTDKDGNPVDEDGKQIICVGTGKNGEVTDDDIAAWQDQFIKFFPSDSIALDSFDKIIEATGKSEDGEDVVTFDQENQKFIFYLTACWSSEAIKPYTSYITVNTRADVDNGSTNTVPWFGGEWYAVNERRTATDKELEDKLVALIRAAYSRTSYLDAAAAGGSVADGVTVTIDKDKLTEFMAELAKENDKYLWYTFDDEQNGWDEDHKIDSGTYTWLRVKDKQEVPVWFLYTLGGVKVNTDINGYDQPLPYKLTLTLPTYEGNDRTPLVFEEDGSVLDWDATNYRYTAGNESEFFVDQSSSTKYSVGVTFTTGTHTGEKTTTDGRTILKNTDYTATDSAGSYLFLTSASGGTVKVENYLGNEDALTGDNKLKLKPDPKDPTGQTYYAVVYLGKGDSIAIPALPQGTTYGLELHNVDDHPDFSDSDNTVWQTRHKYDGYEMEKVEADYAKTSTIWTGTAATVPTGAEVVPGDHNDSKNYFNVALTKKNDAGKDIGFTSKAYEIKDAEGKVTATYKGINAYDTQVINVTSKGTYTIYLDQYTSVHTEGVDGNGDVNEDAWSTGSNLQVQNFNYLSYIATARNLTNSSQTLTITLAVESLELGTKNWADRLLVVAQINGVDQPWNPDDKDEGTEGGKDTKTDVDFGNGVHGEATWVYDYDKHAIAYTVTNVPAGVTISLTARNTVPAVNTATDYAASATLDPTKTDTTAEKLDSNEVNAYVFSNWLRIAAFIGGSNYTLTSEDKQQVFEYQVTLTNPEGTTPGTGPIAQGNIIKYMLFTSSENYGTENGKYYEVEIDTDTGSFTFTIDGIDEDEKSIQSLKHDYRIVIYEILDPEETTDDEYDGETEALKGVGYTVTWVPKDNAQKGAYSVYLNAYDEGKTLGRPGGFTYSSHIGEGIDMVVYRYMPSNSLTVSKEVQGDQTTEWKFDIKLTNKDLNELGSEFDVTYSDDTMEEGTWGTETVVNDDGTSVTYVTFTVTLKHGQNIIINGLPQGTEYIITESAKVPDLVFTPSYVITGGEMTKNNDGTYTANKRTDKGESAKTATGSIYVNQKYQNDDGDWENVLVKDENGKDVEVRAENVVAFTNSMSGNLVIEKEVQGYDAKDKNTFTFEVTLTLPEGATPPKGLVQKKDENGDPVSNVFIVTVSVGNDGKGFTKIEGLPNGTGYTVVETGIGTDYISSWKDGINSGTISGGDNTVTCTNEKTGTLTVQKEVVREAGSKTDTGSRTDDFKFTVTLNGTGLNATGYTAKFTTMGENPQELDKKVKWEEKDGVLIGTFTLAHGQQVSIVGLPAGTMYTVEEANEGNYKTTIKVDGGDAIHSKTTEEARVALWSGNNGTGTVVHYENSRSGTTPGGILLNFLWAIPLCLLAIGGMAAIVIKRRKRAAL